MADQDLLQHTLDGSVERTPFINKEVLYTQDLQNGSYSWQIVFETSQLENSGMWLDYSNGHIQIPFVIAMKSTADSSAAGVMNSFCAGLKAGSHHLVDSIQVDMNNTTIVQQTSYLNHYVSYKLMSTFSKDDVSKYGAITQFIPDSVDGLSYSAAAARGGDGYRNNATYVNPDIDYATGELGLGNSGYLKRLQTTSVGRNDAATILSQVNGLPAINATPDLGKSQLLNVGKSYLDGAGVAGNTRIVYWNIMATIRLRDVVDFFDKAPLLRGCRFRITIRYNSYTTVVTNAGAVPSTQVLTSTTSLAGNTCPFMVSSSLANNPNDAMPAGAITVTCGIKSALIASTTVTNSMLSTCRLYVDAYELDPAVEQELLTRFPTRDIEYDDIYQFTSPSVALGANFNLLISNGETNLQKVVVIPQATVGAAVGKPYESPFDSSPATTCPIGMITNFNCLVGGKNVLSDYEVYDFQQFLDEMSKDGSISSTVGLENGLIGFHEWDIAYRYYVVDLARRVPAEDVLAKSVSIIGRNNTNIALDLFVFLVKRKKITIDMSSGRILV